MNHVKRICATMNSETHRRKCTGNSNQHQCFRQKDTLPAWKQSKYPKFTNDYICTQNRREKIQCCGCHTLNILFAYFPASIPFPECVLCLTRSTPFCFELLVTFRPAAFFFVLLAFYIQVLSHFHMVRVIPSSSLGSLCVSLCASFFFIFLSCSSLRLLLDWQCHFFGRLFVLFFYVCCLFVVVVAALGDISLVIHMVIAMEDLLSLWLYESVWTNDLPPFSIAY